MTRERQTFYIILAMAIVGFALYGQQRRQDRHDPYAACWPMYQQSCMAHVAGDRLLPVR